MGLMSALNHTIASSANLRIQWVPNILIAYADSILHTTYDKTNLPIRISTWNSIWRYKKIYAEFWHTIIPSIDSA